MRFLREIIFSLHDIVVKYAIDIKFCSIYEIAVFNGLIVTILFLIFSLFSYYYFKLDNFEEYFKNFDNTKLLVCFGFMITQLGLYLSCLFTNRDNTPCHIFIIYIFGQIAYYIDSSSYSIYMIICLIFILFLSLIFNEIIEINCWGLSENLKRKISERADNEEFFLSHRNYTIDEDPRIISRSEVTIELVENDVYE